MEEYSRNLRGSARQFSFLKSLAGCFLSAAVPVTHFLYRTDKWAWLSEAN